MPRRQPLRGCGVDVSLTGNSRTLESYTHPADRFTAISPIFDKYKAMTRLSSRWTFFYKRLFPVIWFGFIALFLLPMLINRHQMREPPPAVFIVPVVMGVFGYLLFRRLLFDLVDEVWDDGEALVARNGGVEQRIPLETIINVGFSTMTRPERVTLRLREPGPLGAEVTFMPPSRFVSFGRHPVIDELIERVDRARRAH